MHTSCLPLDPFYRLCFGRHNRNTVSPCDEMHPTTMPAISVPVANENYSFEIPVSIEDAKKEEIISVSLSLQEVDAPAIAAELPQEASHDAPAY